MKKQKNTTLAFDILREEKKRTALWFTRALKKSDSLKKNWAFFSVGIIIEV